MRLIEEAPNRLQEGPVEFTVKMVQEKVSSKGNPMMELKLQVWDVAGDQKIVRAWLVMPYQIRQFLRATNQHDSCPDAPLPGEMPVNVEIEENQCHGKSGKAILKLNDKGYESIDEFIDSKTVVTKASASKENTPFDDDDIPFGV